MMEKKILHLREADMTTAEHGKKVVLEKEALEKLEIKAQTDPLTGIRNRRSGEEKIGKLLKEGAKGALLMMDLDHFKRINDTYGHFMGDKILKKFAEILIAFTRKEDVVYRYGGDEFAVFLKGFTDPSAISERCSLLIARTEYYIGQLLNDSLQSEYSTSIGVAVAPEDGKTFTELALCADKGMYKVKQSGGRGCFCKGEFGTVYYTRKGKESIDVLSLRSMVEETTYAKGSFAVNYDYFKMLFRFLQRYSERNGANVQMVVLTLKGNENEDLARGKVMQAEQMLSEVVEKTLRRGDVAASYGANQFLIMLMDTDTERGKIALRHIQKNWEEVNQDYTLDYEIQSMRDLPSEVTSAS